MQDLKNAFLRLCSPACSHHTSDVRGPKRNGFFCGSPGTRGPRKASKWKADEWNQTSSGKSTLNLNMQLHHPEQQGPFWNRKLHPALLRNDKQFGVWSSLWLFKVTSIWGIVIESLIKSNLSSFLTIREGFSWAQFPLAANKKDFSHDGRWGLTWS